MTVPLLLARIRTTWLHRVSNSIARGAITRKNFREGLSRFFDLLIQAVETGNPACLDPLISEYASASTQSALLEGQRNVTAVVHQVALITLEIAREDLSGQEALDLLSAVLPIFMHALEKAAELESGTRLNYLSRELADVQGRLEKLDRSKSNFIAIAAHELKTPLTLIEGYATMLRDQAIQGRDVVQPGIIQADNARVSELLDGIANGILRLNLIINDMIDVSLIDNGLLSLTWQPVWLNQVFDLLKADLTDSLTDRRQTLTVRDFPGADGMLFADPGRLYQALKNLLVNAIKYTPDRGKVEVDGRLLPGFIEITISDNGIGISQEDQDAIFAKFGRLGNALQHSSGKTKFKGGGPGLGLAITRGIIEAHGGTIWVESEGYDEVRCPGSIFHVLLPLRTAPPDPGHATLFGLESREKEGPS